MNKTKKFILAMLALSLPFLSGCSEATIFTNYREIEDLEIIQTLGIDKSEKGVELTISSGPGLMGGLSNIYTKENETLALAVEDIQKLPEGKESILSHTENILISEEAAENGISGYMDFVERATEMRLDTNLFIVKGGTAKDLIVKSNGENASSSEMLKFMKDNIDLLGEGYVFTCRDTIESLALRGCAMVMAVAEEETEKFTEKESEISVVPGGFALLKDGKLIGYFTEEETRGAVLLIEKVREMPLTLDYNGIKVSVFVTGVSTKYEPEFDDSGTVKKVKVKIDLQADIISVEDDINLFNEEVRKELSEQLAEKERKYAEAAILRSQKENADFMWTGGFVESAAAVKYQKMPKTWEEIFPDVEFEISAKAEIRRTYNIEDPVNVKGEEAKSLWSRLTELVKGS